MTILFNAPRQERDLDRRCTLSSPITSLLVISAFEEARPLEHPPDRVDDRNKIEIARCDFMQHGCEGEEVLTVN
jgi:hypothetical protein